LSQDISGRLIAWRLPSEGNPIVSLKEVNKDYLNDWRKNTGFDHELKSAEFSIHHTSIECNLNHKFKTQMQTNNYRGKTPESHGCLQRVLNT
jgi:hypothetical protein